MLEVVDEQQRFAVAQLGQLTHTDRPRNCDLDELGSRDLCERNEEDAAGEVLDELGPDLQCQPCLAATTRACDRHQAGGVAQPQDQLGDLPVAADERAAGDRQVRRVETLQRRELAVAELVNPLRRRQVLQAMLAEIAERVSADEFARRL